MGAWKPPAGGSLLRLIAGIEAGVVGGLAMLGVMVAGSLLRGNSWWEIPNLLGTTFYGGHVLRSGVGVPTMAGVALHLSLAGSIGAIFGRLCGGIRNRGRLLLLGIAVGLASCVISSEAFWPLVNPLVPLYVSTPLLVLSYLVFGASLGFIGQPGQAEAEPPPDGVE